MNITTKINSRSTKANLKDHIKELLRKIEELETSSSPKVKPKDEIKTGEFAPKKHPVWINPNITEGGVTVNVYSTLFFLPYKGGQLDESFVDEMIEKVKGISALGQRRVSSTKVVLNRLKSALTTKKLSHRVYLTDYCKGTDRVEYLRPVWVEVSFGKFQEVG